MGYSGIDCFKRLLGASIFMGVSILILHLTTNPGIVLGAMFVMAFIWFTEFEMNDDA